MTGGFRETDQITFDPGEVATGAAAVRVRSAIQPRVAFILGSGLGGFADCFSDRTAVPYKEIPGFPRSTVPGHAGNLVLGHVEGVPVVAQQGRFHPYEGYSAATVSFPLRVMHALGARILVVTNAAGGANPGFRPGDLMLIEDHINFQFRAPIRGSGPLVDDSRFVDLACPFSPRLRSQAAAVALELGIPIRHGTYWGNLGPVYETPAEIAMVRRLGGDAVGMSTVSEVIVAAHLGMETLGITCISNLAAGLSRTPLNHEEVIDVTSRVQETFLELLRKVTTKL